MYKLDFKELEEPEIKLPTFIGSWRKQGSSRKTIYRLYWKRHRRRGFDPWIGKFSWRKAWEPTVVFLLGKSHGQGSLVGYSPRGHKEYFRHD